jgi:hypothetical protein
MGREEQLVRDWTLVLGSFRARKLKDDRLAKIQLLSTTDRVYHFYNR